MFEELFRRLRISAGFSKDNANEAIRRYKLDNLGPREMEAVDALRLADGEANSWLWANTLNALNYRLSNGN